MVGYPTEVIIHADMKLVAEMMVVGMSGFVIFVLFLLGRKRKGKEE
jgi:hypothetical protein